MSKFSESLTKQIQRLALVKANATEDNNRVAYEALVRADKVVELLAPYLGREDSVTGFTEHTPSCFQQVYATLFAVEDKRTLAQARGDGRLSTAVQQIRNTGNGFRNSVEHIELFLEIDHAELHHIKKGDFSATLPEVTDLLTSGSYYDRLYKNLKKREDLLKSEKPLSDEQKELYLIGPRWNEGKIIEYTTEYIARAFAYRMDADQRKNLIHGDSAFTTALDSLGLIKELAPA